MKSVIALLYFLIGTNLTIDGTMIDSFMKKLFHL